MGSKDASRSFADQPAEAGEARCRRAGSDGFGLLEVLVSTVVLTVCLVGVCGSVGAVLTMEMRLREENLQRIELWAEAERIRAGEAVSDPGSSLIIRPGMRPLREYRVRTPRGMEWKVWREQ